MLSAAWPGSPEKQGTAEDSLVFLSEFLKYSIDSESESTVLSELN